MYSISSVVLVWKLSIGFLLDGTTDSGCTHRSKCFDLSISDECSPGKRVSLKVYNEGRVLAMTTGKPQKDVSLRDPASVLRSLVHILHHKHRARSHHAITVSA